MRIVFQGTVLADGGNRGSPVGLSVSGAKQIQRASFVRADYGRAFDRGNKTISLEWQHTRRFASEAEALHFATRHVDSIPTGEAIAYITSTGGSALQLDGAVLDVPQLVDYRGLKTVHRYRLTGQQITGAALPAWAATAGGISFGGVQLCGGGQDSFTTVDVNGQKLTDLQSLLRASYATPVDMKNRLNAIRWEQSRDFATEEDAELFLLLHAQAVPDGQHDLTMTLDDGVTLTMADTVMQVPTGRRIAATRTVHSYEALGRAITSAAALPNHIDPNADGAINPNAVTHEGMTVTHLEQDVTYTL
ncbi:MAG: hypothetical protein AAF065_11880 [Verrucomicrobiota bacterium]